LDFFFKNILILQHPPPPHLNHLALASSLQCLPGKMIMLAVHNSS
jgi:hypothetical protein